MADHPQQIAHLEYLGDASRFAGQIHALIPKCTLLENFTPAEVRLLTHFMEVYRAVDGMEVIREGDGGAGETASWSSCPPATPAGRSSIQPLTPSS